MADNKQNKQYVSHPQANGNVLISEDVIATIVANAVADVKGVVSLTTKPGADIAEFIGKKNWGRGIKVSVSEDNEVSLDVNITVSYGQRVVSVAQDVQKAISNAVEELTGITIATVNVNVCGIVRQ